MKKIINYSFTIISALILTSVFIFIGQNSSDITEVKFLSYNFKASSILVLFYAFLSGFAAATLIWWIKIFKLNSELRKEKNVKKKLQEENYNMKISPLDEELKKGKIKVNEDE